jgi:hypothetical protein
MTPPGGIPGGRLMSDAELTRLDLDQKRFTTAAAGQLLGLERRQVFRVPAVEGVSGRGRDGPDLKATRAAQQPS